MQSVDVALTGRRLTVWSKTERRHGTCKFGCCLGGAIKEEISFIEECVESD